MHAFDHCRTLNAVIVPESVTTIGAAAFYSCTGLEGVFFAGNAPGDFAIDAFDGSTNTTVYYLPGTGGWSSTFGGCPTALWYLPQPAILTVTSEFGVQANRFGFRISWATNVSVLVESSAKLEGASWAPISTNTLVNGWTDFRDPESANSPARFYRARSQ